MGDDCRIQLSTHGALGTPCDFSRPIESAGFSVPSLSELGEGISSWWRDLPETDAQHASATLTRGTLLWQTDAVPVAPAVTMASSPTGASSGFASWWPLTWQETIGGLASGAVLMAVAIAIKELVFGADKQKKTVEEIPPPVSDPVETERVRTVLNDYNAEEQVGIRAQLAYEQAETVELFIADTKQKHVGQIVGLYITDDGILLSLQEQAEEPRLMHFLQRDVLALRDRGMDLTLKYSRVSDPQYRDKSININGPYQVLVDFSDARVTTFLEQAIEPIRRRLDDGRITEEIAAGEAWRVVKDFVPYDHAFRELIRQGLTPRRLFTLGDFIQKGICNERGALLQVSLQYLGIRSEIAGGYLGSPEHPHAFVYVWPDTKGEAIEMILDPQMNRVFIVGQDDEARLYFRESHEIAKPKVMTHAGLGMPSDVMQKLRKEGASMEDIMRMQSVELRQSGEPLSVQGLQRLRRQQIELRFRMNVLADAKLNVVQHGAMQIDPYAPWQELSPAQSFKELQIATAVYDRLELEDHHELWLEERAQSPMHIRLPSSYVELYTRLRLDLHESGEAPFGSDPNRLFSTIIDKVDAAVQERREARRTQDSVVSQHMIRSLTSEQVVQRLTPTRAHIQQAAIEAQIRYLYPVLSGRRYDRIVEEFARGCLHELEGMDDERLREHFEKERAAKGFVAPGAIPLRLVEKVVSAQLSSLSTTDSFSGLSSEVVAGEAREKIEQLQFDSEELRRPYLEAVLGSMRKVAAVAKRGK